MKTPRPRIHTIYDHVYKFQWMIIFGGTLNPAIATFAEWIGVKPWKWEDGSAAHFTAVEPHSYGLLWFKDRRPSPGYIAHEALHGTLYLADTRGLPRCTQETDEPYAYYVQWLVEKIIEFSKLKRSKHE